MKRLVTSICIAAGFLAGAAHAQSGVPVIYPAKGQTAQQQDQDKYQCHGWAREQSGFDPMQPVQASQPSQPATGAAAPSSSTTTGNGLVKSAAMGAAVGELAHHDAGRGAAVGVLGGALLQGAKQRQAAQAQQQAAQQQQRQQEQQQQQQQAARAQQKGLFERAFGACMEARGYVLK